MNKSLIKVIALITVFSMTITFIVGTIAMKRSTEYLTVEIEGKILNTAENFANDFSASFNHMEGMTDSLASHVLTTFDNDAYRRNNEGYVTGYKEELAELIKTNMNMASSAHSLYVTFNPNLTAQNDEVWYAMVDGEIQKIEADFQNNKREFEYPYADDMVYFFEPLESSTGVWTGPYYDKDIDEEVFSYSRAIYKDGLFIGVAGADINADDTVNIINEMKLYDGGYSALLDENFNFVVHPGEDETEESVIKKELKKAYKAKNIDNGNINYSHDGERKILGFARMDNGWTMIIVQPENEAYEPVQRLEQFFLLLTFILALVLVAFLIAFSQPFLKKQSSLEAENKEKEILLIYQSRQAKIGEMVGNITHQWKQPLNTIKLIMANLLDSYRYDDLTEERIEKSVNKVDGIIDKMAETITDFSEFLKPTKEKEKFDVKECVREAISLMEESLTSQKIAIEIKSETEEKAYGYYNETVHVIFNILNNARDAVVSSNPEKRSIEINIYEEADTIAIDVINCGENIPEANLDKLFEPYFTTREDSGGTGLGLYISKQIMEDRNEGVLYIENVECGVRCGLKLPKDLMKETDDEK